MSIELHRGRLYQCDRDAVVKAAVDNIAIATTLHSWLTALINLHIIKETDPTPKIEKDLLPLRIKNAIFKVSGDNPTVKTLQELTGRTISFFNKLGSQLCQEQTELAEIYADDKNQLDKLNFNSNQIGRTKLLQPPYGRVETIEEDGLTTGAQPIKKFTVGQFKTIRDLKLFMLNYYHALVRRTEEKSASRHYDSGQFLLREILFRALLKEYKGLFPDYKQYREISAEQQAEINDLANKKLGFKDLQELSKVFWGGTNILGKHADASFKLLGITDAQRPIIREVKGRDQALIDLQAEYTAWASHINSKYQDGDSIEKYLADNSPLNVTYSVQVDTSPLKATRRTPSAPASLTNEMLDERDQRIPGHVWPRLASASRRLEFVRELKEQLPKITAKTKGLAHPREVLIRFYLLHAKETEGLGENKAMRAAKDLNQEQIFAEINNYLNSNSAERKPMCHKLIHAGSDLNRQAKQLKFIFQYIQELASKVNDVAAFVDHLTNKPRLLEMYHKILDSNDFSNRNSLPWETAEWHLI